MTLTPLAISSVTATSTVTALAVLSVLTLEQVTALSIAGAALITAIGGQIVNIIVASKTTRKVEKVEATLEEVKTKAEVIVGHVNSEKTAAQGREATLEAENVLLRQIIAEKKETAMLLAQAVATTQPAAPAPAPSTAPLPLEMKIVNPPDDPANVTNIPPADAKPPTTP